MTLTRLRLKDSRPQGLSLQFLRSLRSKVLSDLEQFRDSEHSEASDAEGAAEGRNSLNSDVDSAQTHWTLQPKTEPTARAALQALFSFSCLDLCMLLNRGRDFADVVEGKNTL